MDYRIEHDSMGDMQVPADKYWGAQTQRSHENSVASATFPGFSLIPRRSARPYTSL